MKVKLDVGRYNPEADENNHFREEFELEVEDHYTVLDALMQIRDYEDPSLAMRCSCRASICGSCAMKVNGTSGLACNTKIIDVIRKDGSVKVDPAGNLPVVKDLVVDMQPFWNKMREIKPYIQVKGPEPEAEYIAPQQSMLDLVGAVGCIMCGACYSDCTVLEVDSNFLGPAALAKASRFIDDPRDEMDAERFAQLNQYTGVWDCTRCMACVEVCPKGVFPMDRIMSIRDKIMNAGMKNTNGARHAEGFASIIKNYGTLDETQLVIKTFGVFNPIVALSNIKSLFGLLPVAFRAFRKKKLPPIFHHKIVGVAFIKKIFKKLEA
jgi:succinate dehydrogenase / fumarate reductase iron-sulfur subunit